MMVSTTIMSAVACFMTSHPVVAYQVSASLGTNYLETANLTSTWGLRNSEILHRLQIRRMGAHKTRLTPPIRRRKMHIPSKTTRPPSLYRDNSHQAESDHQQASTPSIPLSVLLEKMRAPLTCYPHRQPITTQRDEINHLLDIDYHFNPPKFKFPPPRKT